VSGYFGGGGGGGGTPTQELNGRILWFRSPCVHVINRSEYGNGQVPVDEGGISATSVFVGTAQADGATGFGGYTETAVSCNCWYTTTQTPNTFRGFNHNFVSNTNDPYGANGIYGHAYARFVSKDQLILLVGFSRAQPQPEQTTNAYVGFAKRSSDSNWQIATCVEGTGWTYVDTGVAFNADTWLHFEIEYRDVSGTRTLYAWLNGVLVGTITTNLPTNTDSTFVPGWYVGSFIPLAATPVEQVGFISHAKYFAYNSGKGEAYARKYS
jgi:hypothetical protein